MEQLKPNPWIVWRDKQPAAKLRLFCFPYAGGGTSIFRSWMGLLSPQIEVCAIQLPGREMRIREKPYHQIERLVEEIIKEMSTYMDKPFVMFGHSLGALIGFEVARQLRRERLTQPLHLFVGGRRAPQLPERLALLHNLNDRDFIEGLKRYNGLPQAILQEKEIMELFLPVLRADITLHEKYEYTSEPPFDYPVTALGGVNDVTVNREEILAWQQQTSNRFTSQFFPGDHFFLNEDRDTLLQLIKKEVLNS